MKLKGALLALAIPGVALAAPPPTKTSTTARTVASAEDRELAQYIDVLEEYELLERMDLVSVLAALEDEE